MVKEPNRYSAIIEAIFFKYYQPGQTSIRFERAEIVSTVDELGIERPDNLGDILYSFRFRTPLPESIRTTAPKGEQSEPQFLAEDR